jgi:protein TonB
MKGQFHTALVLSVVAHGALVVLCPVPSLVESGQAGLRQHITVLGVVQVAAAPERAEEPQPACAAAAQRPPLSEPPGKEPQTEPGPTRPPTPAEQAPAHRPPPEPWTVVAIRPQDVAALCRQIEEAGAWVHGGMQQLVRNCRSAVTLPPVAPVPVKEATPPESEDRGGAMKQEGKGEPADSRPSGLRAPTLAESPSQGVKGSPGSEHTRRGQVEDIRSRYLAGVLRRLQEAKRYPSRARRWQIEGRLELELVIRKDGSTFPGRILQSSGHDVLDEAALGMVERAAPFEALPERLGVDSLELVVPVSYTLR